MTESAGGAFLNGMADSWRGQQQLKAQKEARELAREQLLATGRYTDATGRGAGGYGGGASQSGRRAGGDYAAIAAQDPALQGVTPMQAALLNAISSGESPNGAYNVRYSPSGGQTFDLEAGHPRIYEEGPAGKSSAAGRYQFTWSTWQDVAGADTPFTRENQDRYALQLAADRYHATTQRDLWSDLEANGLTHEMMTALAPTWASWGTANGQKGAAQVYADTLARYAPKPAAQPAASVRAPINLGPLSFGGAAAQPAAAPLSMGIK